MNKVPTPWADADHARVDGDALAAANRYLDAARALDDRSAWPLKMFTAANLFLWHVDAFESEDDPVPPFVAAFGRAALLLEKTAASGVIEGAFPSQSRPSLDSATDDIVGEIYGEAWSMLTDVHYFDQCHARMVERLTRNGVNPVALFGNKVVLDAGCGSGNYTSAMVRLGAARVIGIDVNEAGLEFARAQARKVPYGDRLEYRRGSAFEIPLPDASVDIVWSNSVVHVTSDYEGCIRDAARVLKPGGTLFLYVDGPMGLFGLLADTLLAASADVPRDLFQHYLVRLGIDPGRITWMMANLYVPYHRRSREAVEALLRRNGFSELHQLTRGIDTDPIERITSGRPFATTKFGEGQLKYLAQKG